MKFFFKLIILIFLTNSCLGQDFSANYTIKTKGLTIGQLYWEIKLFNEGYTTLIKLKNKGFISAFYKFEGKYQTKGRYLNKVFLPSEYNQRWVTNKKRRDVSLFFKNNKVYDLKIKPEEKELPRIAFKNYEDYKDPLTSFINILLNDKKSKTIDGRRMYVMNPLKKNSTTKILIEDYRNIWADHKRNDLEYLEIFRNKNEPLPKKLNIKFKGSVFSLIKN
tara:strand:+ start:408 stop:1067 length:660 start_codon:yes stop_codon:yes gene_type:complete